MRQPPDWMRPAQLSQADEERTTPATARDATFGIGRRLEQTNNEMAARNRPEPDIFDHAASALVTAMGVLGPGRGPMRAPPGRVGGPRTPAEPPSGQPETIKSPAVRVGDKVFEGTDHGDAWVKAGEPEFGKPGQQGLEDGFTTSTGRFVSRTEALVIANKNNQVSPKRLDEMARNPSDVWNYRLNSEDIKPPRPPLKAETQNAEPAPVPKNKEYSERGVRVYGAREGEYGANHPRVEGKATPVEQLEQGIPEAGGKNRVIVPNKGNPERGLGIFPEDYYDKMPQTRRLSGAGISHPGARWEIVDKQTNTTVATYMNRIKASRRQDKLDNTYGGYRYRVDAVRAPEDQLTEGERAFMQKHGIDFNKKRK